MEGAGRGNPGIPAQVDDEVWRRVGRPTFHFRSTGHSGKGPTRTLGRQVWSKEEIRDLRSG